MRFLLISAVILIFASCKENEPESTKSSSDFEKTIIFSSHGFNSSDSLRLLPGKRFSYEQYWASCFGGSGSQRTEGTYRKRRNEIVLEPKYVYVEDAFEGDLIKEFPYHPDSLIVPIKMSYFQISWRGNEYLVSEEKPIVYDEEFYSEEKNDFFKFAQYYNSQSRDYKFNFLCSEGEGYPETCFSDFDFEQIPEKWRGLFLKSPISLTISKVLKVILVETDYTSAHFGFAELDKGSDDGIYEGLEFFREDYRRSIEIDSVSPSKSYSWVYLTHPDEAKTIAGQIFKTRWRDKSTSETDN